MPPKVKITKKDIIKTGVELVRKDGYATLNARNLALALNCSTQPVFSNFGNMEEVEKAVISSAYELYLEFLRKEDESGKYPRYKAFGMAYIRFAKEEKELFKLLFMRDRGSEEDKGMSPDFKASVEMISQANGITPDAAKLMHLEMWGFVHGIGTMLATSFFTMEWELISDMLTDVYQGLRSRFCKKANEEE